MVKCKKAISVLLVLSSIICVAPNSVLGAIRHEFEINVPTLDPADYEETSQKFTMVDLTEYANRDFTDDVEGDGKGGWSDQGENDMRMYPDRGVVSYLDVPFNIIEPADNDRKAVVGLRGQNDAGLPTRVDIPINQKAAGAYFLQSAPYGGGGVICGQYEFVYEDGTSAYINLKGDKYINDFWSNQPTNYYRIVYTGENAKIDTASLSMLPVNNPYPDKTIKSIGIETTGNGAYIMVVGITLTNNGPYLLSLSDETLNPNRRRWVAYNGADENIIKGSIIDFSDALDAPAGKHGAVVADGDTLKFTDGTDTKFWGTNIVGSACFPDDIQAERLADTIARCGVNLVRFSEIDKFIFGNNEYGNIDSSMADKLCKFIEKLKERGIYTYLAPISDDRFALKGFFDDELIELQKKFIKNLLTYKNPDTGIEIGKDSAIVMLEFADSNSMFALEASKGVFGVDKETREVIDKKYNEFIKEKYQNDKVLKRAYGEGYGFNSNETIADGTMTLKLGWRTEILSKAVGIDIREFMAKTQVEYYKNMNSVVGDCGSSLLTTGNSNPAGEMITGDAYANSNADFVSRNALWAMPATNKTTIVRNDINGIRTSMLQDNNVGIFGELAGSKIMGTPYVISSYGTAMINPYLTESIVMMSAIGGQQGWTPLHYAFAYNEIPSVPVIDDYYGMYNDPGRTAVLAACSKLYRGMERARTTAANMTNDGIFEANDSNVLNLEERLKFSSGILLSKTQKSKSKAFNGSIIKNNGIYIDKEKGFFAAQTNDSSALTMSKSGTVSLSKFKFKTSGDFSTVVLTAKDSKNFANANSMLLTAVGRTMNSSMKLDALNTIIDEGKSPVYVEPVEGRFVLKDKGSFMVYAIDLNGQRIKEIPVDRTWEGSVIDLKKDYGCIYYEIVRK